MPTGCMFTIPVTLKFKRKFVYIRVYFYKFIKKPVIRKI